jgi:hypothetical protein
MVDEEKVVVPDELPEDAAELEALAEAGELGVIEVPEVAEPEAGEAPPNEPDEPLDEMPEEDPKGVVTILSKSMFKKLTSAWHREGKPNRLTAFGVLWLVVDDGAKFVSKGQPGAMGDYGSLSTG